MSFSTYIRRHKPKRMQAIKLLMIGILSNHVWLKSGFSTSLEGFHNSPSTFFQNLFYFVELPQKTHPVLMPPSLHAIATANHASRVSGCCSYKMKGCASIFGDIFNVKDSIVCSKPDQNFCPRVNEMVKAEMLNCFKKNIFISTENVTPYVKNLKQFGQIAQPPMAVVVARKKEIYKAVAK